MRLEPNPTRRRHSPFPHGPQQMMQSYTYRGYPGAERARGERMEDLPSALRTKSIIPQHSLGRLPASLLQGRGEGEGRAAGDLFAQHHGRGRKGSSQGGLPSHVHPPASFTLRGCNRVVSLSLSGLKSDWKESSCPQACHRVGLGCCRDLAYPPAVHYAGLGAAGEGQSSVWAGRLCFPSGKLHRAPSGPLLGGLLQASSMNPARLVGCVPS